MPTLSMLKPEKVEVPEIASTPAVRLNVPAFGLAPIDRVTVSEAVVTIFPKAS